MTNSNFATIDFPRFFESNPGGSTAISGMQNFALTMPQALLAAGKPPKVAVIAIIRKLLILANALLRDGRAWSPRLA